MRNKLLLLLATFISFNSYSMSVKTDKFFEPIESKNTTFLKSINFFKSGFLNTINLNSIVVDSQTFRIAKDLKVYDGKLESKKFINFLLSPENEVIEIWVKK